MTQLTINNEYQQTIDMSSAMTNFEKEMNTFIMLIELLNNDKVKVMIEEIKSVQKFIQEKICTFHENSAKYINKKRKMML